MKYIDGQVDRKIEDFRTTLLELHKAFVDEGTIVTEVTALQILDDVGVLSASVGIISGNLGVLSGNAGVLSENVGVVSANMGTISADVGRISSQLDGMTTQLKWVSSHISDAGTQF